VEGSKEKFSIAAMSVVLDGNWFSVGMRRSA
jgi:hypothetical protein